MGLELLQDAYMLNGRVEDERAILVEVTESCDMAVTILNELLIFEKLESNTLELKLKPILPHNYITEILKPFRSQVILHSYILNTSTLHSYILNTSTLHSYILNTSTLH